MLISIFRARTVLLLGLLPLCLGACGGEDGPQGVRVRILTSEIDGPVQGRLQLRAFDEGSEVLYDLQPLGEDEPDLFVAPGTSPGPYGIVSTESWGMLWSGRGASAPLLRGGDYPATLVRMGRPRTLYVAAADPNLWRASLEWGADWRSTGAAAGEPGTPIPIEIRQDVEGIVALGFPEASWKPDIVLRVLGRFEGGVLSRLFSFTLRENRYTGLPLMKLLEAAPQAPLSVFVLDAAGSTPVPDGTRVRVETVGLPLVTQYEVGTRKGEASFDSVVVLGHGLRISLPDGGPQAVFDLDPELRRARLGTTLLHVPRDAAIPVELPKEAVAASEVRVLGAGSARYGRAPLLPAGPGSGPRFLTAPGRQSWLVPLPSGSWMTADDVDPDPAGDVSPVWKGPLAGCTVRGFVKGAGAGYGLECIRLIAAEGSGEARRVGGEGLKVRVSMHGRYEARLPPGRYAIRVLGPGGGGNRPVIRDLSPGTQMRMDLSWR